jgi:protein-L-isoaspartate(D-aspartate) O-methyltransferase
LTRTCLILGGLALLASCAPPGSFEEERKRMVSEQVQSRGVTDERVVSAMLEIPRHRFVPEAERAAAYDDRPLSIGHGQAISQPYIVALMTDLARPMPGDRALEVGTGSGYQAAVLSRLVKEVFTIEIVPELGAEAARRLKDLGYANVQVRVGDGFQGWPEAAPFDVILVTAAPEEVPEPLLEQLKPGGRLVIPVGPTGAVQSLQLVAKDSDGRLQARHVLPVRFVPFTRSP